MCVCVCGAYIVDLKSKVLFHSRIFANTHLFLLRNIFYFFRLIFPFCYYSPTKWCARSCVFFPLLFFTDSRAPLFGRLWLKYGEKAANHPTIKHGQFAWEIIESIVDTPGVRSSSSRPCVCRARKTTTSWRLQYASKMPMERRTIESNVFFNNKYVLKC